MQYPGVTAPMTPSDDERLIRSFAEDGCDMELRREVGVFFQAPSKAVAEMVAADLRADGWDSRVLAPEGDLLGFANGKWIALNRETIAALRRYAEGLASRHGAVYYAWQATMDPMSPGTTNPIRSRQGG